MRTFTMLFLFLFTSLSMSAQVFVVNSPESVAGGYNINFANFGPSLDTMIVCGDLMMGEPNEGCTPLTNDLTGKIAVIDRGVCNFSLKIYHAQAAGAVGCIIVNNQSGFALVTMAPGDSATAIVIPSVFVTNEEGSAIKDVMANETVNACMGNIVLPNDVASGINEVSAPFSATVPKDQIVEAGSAAFTPIARVTNKGGNPAANVTANTTIAFGPGGSSALEVYNESGVVEVLEAGADTLIELTEFDYSGSDIGSYTVNYTITTDSLDDLTFDNDAAFSFDVTENVFAEGPWDYVNNHPIRSFATSIGGIAAGDPTDWELVSSFEVPAGVGYRIDSIMYYVEVNPTSQATLDGITVKAKLYEWIDGSGATVPDVDGVAQNDEVELVAIHNQEFTDADGEGRWVTATIQDNLTLEDGYIIPDDGAVYFVGTEYDGIIAVEFGFNGNYGFNLLNTLSLLNTDADPTYLLSTNQQNGSVDFEDLGIFTDGAGFSATHAMYINSTTSSVDQLTELEAEIKLFPNPASQVINTVVVLEEMTSRLEYSITDMQGRQIFSAVKTNVKEDRNEFMIEQLPAGIYNLNITTDKGIKTERFNVQH